MTQAELAKIIAFAVEQALAAKAGKPAKGSTSSNGKSERSLKNEKLAITAFKKAGFGTVVPHQDVKSFSRWAELDMRPVEGTKAVKVKNLRLFHKSQVRHMTSAEIQKLKTDREAFASRLAPQASQQATA